MAFILKSGIIAEKTISRFIEASGIGKKSILQTTRATGSVSPIGLKYIPKTSGDVADIQRVIPLNFDAPATRFFGIDSLENLNKLETMVNHIKLNEEMAKLHCYSGRCTDIEHFKKLFFDMPYNNGSWQTAKDMCTPHFPIGVCGIKMTFTGFKFKGKDALHSIGFIRDGKGQLFIIDSLGNTTPEMQAFHKQLSDIILAHEKGVPNGIWKVIFNTKVQQGAEELTCNNWTMANLKAVQDAINNGEQLLTAGALDRILPNDINKILEEQMELAKKSNYSISL